MIGGPNRGEVQSLLRRADRHRKSFLPRGLGVESKWGGAAPSLYQTTRGVSSPFFFKRTRNLGRGALTHFFDRMNSKSRRNNASCLLTRYHAKGMFSLSKQKAEKTLLQEL